MEQVDVACCVFGGGGVCCPRRLGTYVTSISFRMQSRLEHMKNPGFAGICAQSGRARDCAHGISPTVCERPFFASIGAVWIEINGYVAH